MDEHSYHTPKWFFKEAKRFDKYKRGTAKVYFGEYAANSNLAGKKPNELNSNLYISALSEAAFLTGVERNSDVVEMTSYAPLFNLVSGSQWYHNLIDFSPSSICYTINYYVQKMFSTHLGEEYIPFEGKLPKNLYCATTADAEFIYIKLVNAADECYSLKMMIKDVKEQTAKSQVIHNQDTNVKNKMNFFEKPQYAAQIKEEFWNVSNGVLEMKVAPFSVNAVTVKR